MKIVHSTEAEIIKDGNVFLAHEYNTNDPDINIARIEINGRYPVNGSMKNMRVKEIVYVESGSGEVTINGIAHEVQQGDVIFFDSGETISWNGTFVLITTCTPAWTKEQHEVVE